MYTKVSEYLYNLYEFNRYQSLSGVESTTLVWYKRNVMLLKSG